MKNRMEKEVLQTVTMDENKVKWVKPGKEAWINGRLFDIKTRSCQNGHCIFTGFFDDEETALVMELQKNHQQNKKADNDFLAQLFKLIKDVYKNSPGDQLSVPVTTRAQFLTQKSSLFSVDIPILTPPPQA